MPTLRRLALLLLAVPLVVAFGDETARAWPGAPLSAAAVPPPGIPALHDTWWKLKVKAKGRAVDFEGTLRKEKFKTTAYMHVTFVVEEGAPDPSFGDGAIGPLYSYSMWTLTSTDPEGPPPETGWQDLYGDVIYVNGGFGELFTDTFMGFITDDGSVGARFTGEVKMKFNPPEPEGGTLKSAKLKTLGALVFASGVPPENGGKLFDRFYGTMKISGKTVDEEDLPFLP